MSVHAVKHLSQKRRRMFRPDRQSIGDYLDIKSSKSRTNSTSARYTKWNSEWSLSFHAIDAGMPGYIWRNTILLLVFDQVGSSCPSTPSVSTPRDQTHLLSELTWAVWPSVPATGCRTGWTCGSRLTADRRTRVDRSWTRTAGTTWNWPPRKIQSWNGDRKFYI